MSELQKRINLSKLPPRAPAGIGLPSASGRKHGFKKRDYTPVGWDQYFDRKDDVKTSAGSIFRVYHSGENGPVCLFLHGGGFSALSWAVLSKNLIDMVECRCLAMDLRGHGDTYTSDDLDLSADQMSQDIADVVSKVFPEDCPPIILIGHSMGGAIATHVGSKNLIPSLIGLMVIDVVEGTALDALTSMQSFLRGRPKSFKSLETAIEWCVRTGQIRNLDSAKVSMVGQLKRLGSGETATSELQKETPPGLSEVTNVKVSDAIQEEVEVEESGGTSSASTAASTSSADNNSSMNPPSNPSPENQTEPQYTWRIDLALTEKFWRGWFEGLSNLFLSCSVPKMLLLAGVDRLDKDLTVGQMQGKFQMQVLPQCGHAVHEDSPERVAEVLATFMIRHKVATAKSNFQHVFPAC